MAAHRTEFTRLEADQIRRLVSQVRNAERSDQKTLRDRIRTIGFYISDFERDATGFTVEDFDELIRAGRIRVA